MTLTLDWLKAKRACEEGVKWFTAQTKTDAIEVLDALIADGRPDWASWLIVRVMTRQQQLAYAIFAAEQVLALYEKKHPEDKRPRLAIEAARAVLASDTEANRLLALAAWSAAEAALVEDLTAGAPLTVQEYVLSAGASWAAKAAAWSARLALGAWSAWSSEEVSWEVAEAAESAWAEALLVEASWKAPLPEGAALEVPESDRKDMRLRILRYGMGLLK